MSAPCTLNSFAKTKIVKPDKKPITPLEEEIAQEMPVGREKAIVIYVPVPQLQAYHSIYNRLVGELEKKLRGPHVVIVAFRRIIPKPKRNSRFNPKQKRPRNRTLTHVHEAILEDLVYPAEITGKRTQVKRDGNVLLKCYLDVSKRNLVEHKIKTITGLYKILTGKDVVIEFQEYLL